ncbi:ran-binding protein 3-like [Synchiropus picturatus]
MGDTTNKDKAPEGPSFTVHGMSKAQKRSPEVSSSGDSDDEGWSYSSPMKKLRTSPSSPTDSLNRNMFMPSTGNSESKSAALFYRQSAVSHLTDKTGQMQRTCVLRPATLQAPVANWYTKDRCEGKDETQLSGRSTRESSRHPSESNRNLTEEVEAEARVREDNVPKHFVFGQNTEERGKAENYRQENTVGQTSQSQSECSNYFLQYICGQDSGKVTSTGDANLIFGQNVLAPKVGPVAEAAAASCSEGWTTVPVSLEEAAAAYTRAADKKCILEKVDIRTGEESERNILQIKCKLYIFEKTAQSWKDRGQGLLRLNDMISPSHGTQSRLVMRADGSLRLLLNTKLWSQMQVKKASQKSVWITAMDTEDNTVKVFLISGSSRDIDQLVAALDHRIMALHSRGDQTPVSATAAVLEEAPSTSSSTTHISVAGDKQ